MQSTAVLQAAKGNFYWMHFSIWSSKQLSEVNPTVIPILEMRLQKI